MDAVSLGLGLEGSWASFALFEHTSNTLINPQALTTSTPKAHDLETARSLPLHRPFPVSTAKAHFHGGQASDMALAGGGGLV